MVFRRIYQHHYVAVHLLLLSCSYAARLGGVGIAALNWSMKIKIAELRTTRLAEHAYTLAEVSISAVLILTVFTALYAGMSSGFAYTQTLRENLRATQVMLERMEGIRLYNWDRQLNSNSFLPSTFTAYYHPAIGGTGVNSGVRFDGTLSVGAVSLSPWASYADNMRLVTVTVNWRTQFGSSNSVLRTRRMRTYVARYGMQNYIYNN